MNSEAGAPAVPLAAPAPQVGAVPARAAGEQVSLAFADAEGAARWADALPFATVGQAYEGLVGQIRAVTAAPFSARERATIAAQKPVSRSMTGAGSCLSTLFARIRTSRCTRAEASLIL